MNIKKLLSLVIITLIVIIAAISFWQSRAPEKSKEKTLLFSELTNQLNDIKIVEIKGYEENVILSHQNNAWLIQSSDNFPALSDKVRSTIINLSELKIDSGKTKNPELYAKLAVEGPYDRQTQSRLISLMDENGDLIASLIVGKKRDGNNSIPALYGRLPDGTQALLLQGKLEVSSEDKDWFEQNIIDLNPDEIKRITMQHSEQESFTLKRENEGQVNFNLETLPEGKKPQSEIILNGMASLLENIRAESVRSLQSFNMSEDSIKIKVETFRGLITNILLTEQDGRYFANFQFQYQTPMEVENKSTDKEQPHPTPEEEIEQLNQRMSPWVFEIAKFKYDDMSKELNDFIRD